MYKLTPSQDETRYELPDGCFSVLPSTGQLIFIVSGAKGHLPVSQSANKVLNRKIANASNELYGITRAQEEAMLAGALSGWDKPAAKPWMYKPDGSPRPLPAKSKTHER